MNTIQDFADIVSPVFISFPVIITTFHGGMCSLTFHLLLLGLHTSLICTFNLRKKFMFNKLFKKMESNMRGKYSILGNGTLIIFINSKLNKK